ncbi:hypothetical protein [Metabacillus litoralis]|uniref:hypothetical protein n=1 Tax=Metabacillus litoralis TaxID=152268 RepID=UPI001CFCE221|nr:hypothetical protein [Metabacillus litoralis]
MKVNSNRRRLQEKYKEKVDLKKNKRKYTLEAIIVLLVFIIFVFLDNKHGITSTYDPTINKVDITENQWMSVIPTMDEKLKVNHPEYKTISIDFNPKPIKYYLNTSMQKSNIETEYKLNELILESNEIITLYQLPYLLKENETYEIIVRGKNKEVLKRESFSGI